MQHIVGVKDRAGWRTSKGNNRADLGLDGELVAKEEHGRADDADALDDVADAVGHRADATEGVESKLVVQMVQQADGDQLEVEGLHGNARMRKLASS